MRIRSTHKRVLALGLLVPVAVVFLDWIAQLDRPTASLGSLPDRDLRAATELWVEGCPDPARLSVDRASAPSSDAPISAGTSVNRQKLLAVPDDYPFDPALPIPPMLRLGNGSTAEVATAIRGNQLGVNPIEATLDDTELARLHQSLAPALEERKLLLADLVARQGDAMSHAKPLADRLFDSEEDAEAFARSLFGAGKEAVRIWGTSVGDRCFVFLVVPFQDGAAYLAHAKLCRLDESIATRMREFVSTR